MVTGCVAQYASDRGVSNQSIACGRGSLSGLCPSTSYNISVAFVNAEGQGPWSRSVGVTTNQERKYREVPSLMYVHTATVNDMLVT